MGIGLRIKEDFDDPSKRMSHAVRFSSSACHGEKLKSGGVMSRGRTAIALRGGAVVFVFAIGCGAGVGVVSQHETPVSAVADGALPVVPVGGGGCIIGLNCGCVHNCPNQHRHPAPATVHPSDAPAGPGGG
jgi:hypothetical protein